MRWFAARGLARVALICPNAVLAIQMNRLAVNSPVGTNQVALDGRSGDWFEQAMRWLELGIRPLQTA